MAEKTEFLQAIDDAILDADSLERFINGSDSETVLTRLSAKYPTLQKALKELFENGGIAGRFKTLTELQASSLADGKYALVADDTDDKNGIYIKQGANWVKSKYDTEATVRRIVERFASLTNGTDFFDFVDTNGGLIARVDNKAEVYLNGLDKSVQANIKELKLRDTGVDVYATSNELPQTVMITDSNGKVVLNIDNEGEAYFHGIEDSLQATHEKLSKYIGNKYFSPKRVNSDFMFPYAPSFVNYALAGSLSSALTAPMPLFTGRQQFEMGNTWIDKIKIRDDNIKTVPIRGYDPYLRDDIGIVHPNVWAFREQVQGYKYWMMLTPYTNFNENIEIPFVYGSNNPDMDDWVLVDNVPTPMEADPVYKDGSIRGYLSDNGITYDVHSGDLIVYWRETLHMDNVVGYDSMRARRFDGASWSEPYYLLEKPLHSIDRLLSFAPIFNEKDGLYYLYFVSETYHDVRYMTSTHLCGGGWSEIKTVNMQGSNKPIYGWHLDAKCVGDKIVLLIQQDKSRVEPADVDAFYLAQSDDGVNFTASKESVIGTDWNRWFYKGTFQPVFNPDGTGYFMFIYTSDAWKLQVVKSNTVNFGE